MKLVVEENQVSEVPKIAPARRKKAPAGKEAVPTAEPTGKEILVAGPKAMKEKDLSPEGLIALGIERGIQIDQMERLLAMRRELKAEAAKESFYHALCEFQSAVPPVLKKESVLEKGSTKVRYTYASIEEVVATIQPYLKEHGFSFRFEPSVTPSAVDVTCIVTHSSGHAERTAFSVPIEQSGFMSGPQKVASALTYTKRYALLNSFGIVTADVDDDGAGGYVHPGENPVVSPVQCPVQKPATVQEPDPEQPIPWRDVLAATYRKCAQWFSSEGVPQVKTGTDVPLTVLDEGVRAKGSYYRLFSDGELDAMAKDAKGKKDDIDALARLNSEWEMKYLARFAGGEK